MSSRTTTTVSLPASAQQLKRKTDSLTVARKLQLTHKNETSSVFNIVFFLGIHQTHLKTFVLQ